jgi:hypothetical protein
VKRGYLPWREAARSDLFEAEIGPHALDVNADLPATGECEENQTVRVGRAKANLEVAGKVRFPVRVVAEAETAGMPAQITPQNSSQHPSRDDEALPVTLEEEIGCLLSFVAGQEAPQDVLAGVSGPHIYAPHVDFV